MTGIRILDLSRVLAGPWATMHLADQGAEVIKVEPPQGDDTRGFGPHVGDVSTYYLSANRNKRSIRLDLRREEDREILHSLAARADVVVQNFRPGVAERLGCDFETLRVLKPDLVFVAITGFGEEGPYASRPGYDLVLQAAGGAMAITGQPGGPPQKCGASIADLMTGMHAVQAILGGLLHRERTGEGQRIVVSMLQVQAHALAYHVTRWFAAGTEDEPRGNGHAGLCPYDVYRLSDGWLAVGCGNDVIFGRLARLLNLDVLPGWTTNRGRVADREQVDAAVANALGEWSVADADDAFAQAGVPASPVLRPSQTAEHPAVQRVQVEHPVLGALPMLAPVIQTATMRTSHTAPPALDADRASILAEIGRDHHGDSGS